MKLWAGWSLPQRGVLIALLVCMLAFLIFRRIVNPTFIPDPQSPDALRVNELEDQIDPNTSDWSTLAALPVIGEKRAKDIIAYREQFIAAHPGRPAFSKLEDLLEVKGIGTATLSQIAPHLRIDSPHPSAATTTAPVELPAR